MLEQGSKSAKFFSERSGGAVLAKICGAERWSGSLEKFGAERWSGNFRKFRFLGVFHEIFAKNCSKGTKTLTDYC
jgi:hypothetical protein